MHNEFVESLAVCGNPPNRVEGFLTLQDPEHPLMIWMAIMGDPPPAFGQLARRDGRLFIAASVLEHVALYLGIAAAVAMLIAEATIHMHGCAVSLWRRVEVIEKDPVDDDSERPEHGGRARLGAGVGPGLG
jgi:hypothetical protein